MAVSNVQPTSTSARVRQTGHPIAGRRFHLLAMALAVWVILGVFVDVNAHNHGEVDNTFFTPWHFLLYSGVFANGMMLVIAQYRNVTQGYAWSKALPRGYFLSLVGVLIFALAGGFDFVWHSLFGFEVNLEALLSPAHLLLAVGASLFVTGPMRSLWGDTQEAAGWRDLLPAIVSSLMMMSLLTLFTQYSNVLTQPDIFTGRGPGGNSYFDDVLMISSVLIPAVIMSGTLLLLLRRWTLPFGAVLFVLGINGLLMFYLRIGYEIDYWLVLVAPLVAGLIGDGLLRTLGPSVQRVGALRLFAFVVPFVYFLTFFIMLMLTSNIWWTIHMWLGVSFMAGITGLLLSYLIAPPTLPETAR